jgi:hypothetical protein
MAIDVLAVANANGDCEGDSDVLCWSTKIDPKVSLAVAALSGDRRRRGVPSSDPVPSGRIWCSYNPDDAAATWELDLTYTQDSLFPRQIEQLLGGFNGLVAITSEYGSDLTAQGYSIVNIGPITCDQASVSEELIAGFSASATFQPGMGNRNQGSASAAFVIDDKPYLYVAGQSNFEAQVERALANPSAVVDALYANSYGECFNPQNQQDINTCQAALDQTGTAGDKIMEGIFALRDLLNMRPQEMWRIFYEDGCWQAELVVGDETIERQNANGDWHRYCRLSRYGRGFDNNFNIRLNLWGSNTTGDMFVATMDHGTQGLIDNFEAAACSMLNYFASNPSDKADFDANGLSSAASLRVLVLSVLNNIRCDSRCCIGGVDGLSLSEIETELTLSSEELADLGRFAESGAVCSCCGIQNTFPTLLTAILAAGNSDGSSGWSSSGTSGSSGLSGEDPFEGGIGSYFHSGGSGRGTEFCCCDVEIQYRLPTCGCSSGARRRRETFGPSDGYQPTCSELAPGPPSPGRRRRATDTLQDLFDTLPLNLYSGSNSGTSGTSGSDLGPGICGGPIAKAIADALFVDSGFDLFHATSGTSFTPYTTIGFNMVDCPRELLKFTRNADGNLSARSVQTFGLRPFEYTYDSSSDTCGTD